MRAAAKTKRGTLRMPISCGGLLVWPGDFVVADDTGVVVLSAAHLEGVLAKARTRQDKEAELMQGLRRGHTTLDLLGLRTLLDEPPEPEDGPRKESP